MNGSTARFPPADRRALREEVLVVLSLSLFASAVYAVLDLFAQPLRGVVIASANQDPHLLRQLIAIAFGLAPVFLVLHLVRRSGEGVGAIGLGLDDPRDDVLHGAVLALVVGAVGVGIYAGAVELGVNRLVVPIPAPGHWFTVPLLFLVAAEAALVEEVIVLGYLITRLQQIGWAPWLAIGGSALLRGSYHLYQGWGAFVGNLAMGVLFGVLFLRWRRTWPFVVAHLLVDAGAGLGYLALKGKVSWLV